MGRDWALYMFVIAALEILSSYGHELELPFTQHERLELQIDILLSLDLPR